MDSSKIPLAARPVHQRVLNAVSDHYGVIETRPSHIIGVRQEEYIVRFHDVCHLMESGDGFWFAGRALHSYLIRIATNSNISHCGLLHRWDCERNDAIKLVDIVEGTGGRYFNFYDEIERYPGQCYWAPVNREAWPNFDGDGAVEEARRIVHKPYGTGAVVLQALTRCVFSRELIYLFQEQIDKVMVGKQPFCSMGQSLWCEIGGGIDPVPGRSAWLTTPQDTWQSLLWTPIKYCLIP